MDEPVVDTFVLNLDKLIDTITERCSNLTTRQAEISSRPNSTGTRITSRTNLAHFVSHLSVEDASASIDGVKCKRHLSILPHSPTATASLFLKEMKD